MNKNEELVIEWPKPTFTINQIQDNHKSVPNITLRYRLNKALKRGEIICIGKLKKHVGRPTLVFAKSTISNDDLFKCKEYVILNDDMNEILSTIKKY
jgi:hypothetical protein